MFKRQFVCLMAVVLLCLGNLLAACSPADGEMVTTTSAATTEAITTTSAETTTETTTITISDETTTTEIVSKSTVMKTTTSKKPATSNITTTVKKTTTSEKTTVTEQQTTVSTTVADNRTDATTTLPETTTSSSRKTVSTRSRATTTEEERNPLAEEAQRIHNKTVYPTTKIDSDVAVVSGFDDEWSFKHHPTLAYFKGKLYAAFTYGYEGEDHPGQHMVVSSSEDFYTWSEPKTIGPSTKGVAGDTAVFPVGMFESNGRLYAQYYAGDFAAECFDENGNFNTKSSWKREDYCYLTWTDDGENWSEPMKIPHGYLLGSDLRKSFISGKWISAWGVQFFWSDDRYPDIFKFDQNYLTNEQRADAKKRNGGTSLSESSWYETKDGVYHILIRSDTGYLWHFKSDDGGKTLTDPYPTRFGTTNSQVEFIQTSTDFIIGVGEPYQAYDPWIHYPLQIWTSTDGYNFDRSFILRDEKYQIQKPGYSKGGYFAYPDLVIEGDYLYVLYSKMKEVIEISRVKLSDLKR